MMPEHIRCSGFIINQIICSFNCRSVKIEITTMDEGENDMKVEIWSDINCPFCYIGKRKFENAVKEFDGEVEVEFKSFQLDPTLPKDTVEKTVDVLAKKYNMTIDRAREMNQQVADTAAEVGLAFNAEKVYTLNTLDAHRVTHLAKEHGKMQEVVENMFESHFVKGELVNDREILVKNAVDAGIEQAEVEALLDSDKYEDIVVANQEEAGQLGVQGVPFFIFDRKYAVSGAQPTEVFADVLKKVKEEANN